MNKPCVFKVRLYTARMIYLNKYLYVLPGTEASAKICETELNAFFKTVCLTSGYVSVCLGV